MASEKAKIRRKSEESKKKIFQSTARVREQAKETQKK